MDHVGIDLGARKSHVIRMGSDGEVVEQRALDTTELPKWLACIKPSRVVMEACTQSPVVARIAMRHGHTAVVISGTLVRALGIGARGIKTDERDAGVLVRASLRNEQLPSVHLRSEPAVHQKSLVATRGRVVKMRTQCSASIKSYLRGQLVNLKGRASSTAFSKTVRELLEKSSDGLSSDMEAMLDTFDFLTKKIEVFDAQLEAMAEQNETCKKLMAIPGVGPQVALAFVSTIDEPSRFKTADELASFLALVPGEATTGGGKPRRTGTIRSGPVWLKALLVQAAWSAWRTTPEAPMVLWARRIADKRSRPIAIIALARKLATVMWAMWLRNESYAPDRASSVRPTRQSNSAAEQQPTAIASQ